MAKICFFLLLLVVLVGVGCSSDQPRGDREFIPGKGWVPVH